MPLLSRARSLVQVVALACAAPGWDPCERRHRGTECQEAHELYQAAMETGSDDAFVDCPCKDLSALPGENGSYGSYCKKWNQGGGECANVSENHPGSHSWCFMPWCYVSPDCPRPKNASDKYQGAFWSYETCGSLGMHYVQFKDSKVSILDKLGNRPLYAWADFKRVSEDQPLFNSSDLARRVMLMFAAEVLEKLGVDVYNASQLAYRNLSAVSLEKHSNSAYTACVHDIALGNIDLCLGDVWDTEERRAMNVNFAGSVFMEDFYLLVPLSYGKYATIQDWQGAALKVFLPFSPGLWVAIVVVVVFNALFMVTFEHHGTRPEVQADGRRTRAMTAVASLHSFMAGEVTLMPLSYSGKILSIGYGFFILVCISCYTANMASILLSDHRTGRFEEIIRDKRTICYHSAMPEEALDSTDLASHLKEVGEKIDDTKPGAAKNLMSCEFSITSREAVEDFWAQSQHCDKTFAGKALTSIPNGFYTSTQIAREMNWMVSKLRMKSRWSKLLKQARSPSLCGTVEGSAGDQLQAWHLSGAILVQLLFLTVAASWRCWEHHEKEVHRAMGRQISEHSISDSDGSSLPDDSSCRTPSYKTGQDCKVVELGFLNDATKAAQQSQHDQRKVDQRRARHRS